MIKPKHAMTADMLAIPVPHREAAQAYAEHYAREAVHLNRPFIAVLQPEQVREFQRVILDRSLASLEPNDWPEFVKKWMAELDPVVYGTLARSGT